MTTVMTRMVTIDEAVPKANRAGIMGPRMNTFRGTNTLRDMAFGLMVTLSLSMAPLVAARAAEDRPTESAISKHARSFGEAVKRDTKAVGATFKEGAHRVAVAAKAVGHEIATAAKRGAAETRSAFRGDKGQERNDR
jgi:hypothetical protein